LLPALSVSNAVGSGEVDLALAEGSAVGRHRDRLHQEAVRKVAHLTNFNSACPICPLPGQMGSVTKDVALKRMDSFCRAKLDSGTTQSTGGRLGRAFRADAPHHYHDHHTRNRHSLLADIQESRNAGSTVATYGDSTDRHCPVVLSCIFPMEKPTGDEMTGTTCP